MPIDVYIFPLLIIDTEKQRENTAENTEILTEILMIFRVSV